MGRAHYHQSAGSEDHTRRDGRCLEKTGCADVADLIDWRVDPVISKIVTSWPAVIDAGRARALGLLPDDDYESIIAEYLTENNLIPNRPVAQ